MSLRKMKAKVSKKFNINVSIGQCRNAKKFALSEVEGSLREHYAKLWEYAGEIRRANPGCHVEINVQPQPNETVIFESMYISFEGVVKGWLEGCRKVIGLDGCFLKGICKGELLSAIGRDGNNNIYPIAWAVVNVENKKTWKWFIDNLMEDIEGGNGRGITLLSDGHKGLLQAVKERVPDAKHRVCTRHILANFHQKFKGEEFIKPYWKAVNASRKEPFEAAMKEIKDLDSRAYDYLIGRDPKCWSKAFFQEGMNCDAVENGVSESFNAAVLDARAKPIITMLEDIRVYVMERLHKQKVMGEGWDLAICPAIRRELMNLKILHRFWESHVSGYQEFEVCQGHERYAVHLGKRECGCRIWQLTGIPCVHGMSAIAKLNLDPEKFVADCYKKESFLASYAYNIHPLNDSSMWPEQSPDLYTILPPKERRKPGRPATKRKRGQAERELSGRSNGKQSVSRSGIAQRCSLCKETGHNKKKCPSNAGPSNSGPSDEAPTTEDLPTQGTQDPPTQGTQVPPTPAPSTPVPVNADPSTQEPVGPSNGGVRAATGGVRAAPGGRVRRAPLKKEGTGVRVRKASGRISKLGLRRKVVAKDGSGCSETTPLDID